MNTEFSGKTVAVTGAGSGMGRAEAQLLASLGAHVWVADIDPTAGEAVIDQIRDKGGAADFYRLDVTDPEGWSRFAEVIDAADGTLDGLVNNAGVSFRYGIEATSVEDWRRVMAINLDSVFYGMRACAQLLKRNRGGSIVNISSIAGMLGYFAAAYGASKWGVRGLSKVGALEFAEHHVRVNSVHPGLVETPLLTSGTTEFVDESLKSVPAGRSADPDEVAETVAFLLSDRSKYITGTEIVIDGGLTSGGLYHRITRELG